MVIEFAHYFNDGKISIDINDIKYIIEYGSNGSKIINKLGKDLWSKESVSEISDKINKLKKNYKNSISIYYKKPAKDD